MDAATESAGTKPIAEPDALAVCWRTFSEKAAAVIDCTAPVGVVDDAIGSTGTEPIVELEAAEKAAAVVDCTAPGGVVDAATDSTGTERIVEV